MPRSHLGALPPQYVSTTCTALPSISMHLTFPVDTACTALCPWLLHETNVKCTYNLPHTTCMGLALRSTPTSRIGVVHIRCVHPPPTHPHRAVAEGSQRARQDVARIEIALESAMRERLVEARKHIARDLHQHLDEHTRRALAQRPEPGVWRGRGGRAAWGGGFGVARTTASRGVMQRVPSNDSHMSSYAS